MHEKTARQQVTSRYKPSADFGGRKERKGFVCASGTWQDTAWCVAVKRGASGVHVRDTKDPSDKTLSFSRKEWDVFVKGVKDGEFDI